MTVSVTELKKNLKSYIELSASEDVVVTSHGKEVTVLTSTEKKRLEAVEGLFGCIPALSDEEIEEMRLERLSKL